MRAAVRRLGNSSGIIIPKAILDEAGVSAGDVVDMLFDEGRIVLVPVAKRVREGWAEAAKAVAEAGDDAMVWPEFGNLDDESLTW
ncbi:MAG TPA: AbrB/MazE/SpoVT family DNA-binding domain-containing protein [Stellaceae bacterium]|jgi:antitoxin MazE|nr:AbrB/MazE/SpoVT family DNA-binding domain-containing protein [Stellaceae bacterium]